MFLGIVVATMVSVQVRAAAAELLPQSSVPPVSKLTADVPDYDDGRHVSLSWQWKRPAATESATVVSYMVFRSNVVNARPLPTLPTSGLDVGDKIGDWNLVAITENTKLKDRATEVKAKRKALDTVWTVAGSRAGKQPTTSNQDTQSSAKKQTGSAYTYAVVAALPTGAPKAYRLSRPAISRPVALKTSWFDPRRWFYLAAIAGMGFALWLFTLWIRRHPNTFVRRIPGVDAIEDAVGRSTEMGRPVLYVTGAGETQHIQTIASLLILGYVGKMTAEYDTELKVANCYPLTMVIAEEIVRQGYANAGRVDAHRPENVMFISAEQFAFAAGTNGIMLRERPAANIYLGQFFAESLILAETGFVTGAVQIAGTAENTQLPFFIAACDYTLIGEELFAVSAYLSREPVMLAQLKATDFLKLGVLVLLVVGAIANTAGWFDLQAWLFPS